MNLIRILVPRFRVLDAEFRARDAFDAMTANDRDQLRLERLNRNWSKALTSGGYYGELASRGRLPWHFRSLQEFQQTVPATPRNAVCANPSAFKLADAGHGRWLVSSGSTGLPVRVFWSKAGHLESLRDQYWARTRWGVDPFEPQAMLWGHPPSLEPLLQQTWKRCSLLVLDRFRHRKRFDACHFDTATLRACYEGIARCRATSLYAYASSAHLLALANRDRSNLPVRLTAAFLTSEPILPDYRVSVREVFGCPCVGEYGSADCGLMAHEMDSQGYRVFERSVLVETVAQEIGYAVYATQLRDTGFPLFRYETGDMTLAPLGRNGGDTEILDGICGRRHDVIRSSSGRLHHGMTFELVLKSLPEVALFKVIQHRDLGLDILVQTKSGQRLPVQRENWIRQRAAELVGADVAVAVRTVDGIERSPAGKHRCVVSELSDRTGVLTP